MVSKFNVRNSGITLNNLEMSLNQELINIHNWLCANKLSLNVDKSYFIIFHPVQKKTNYTVNLLINGKVLVEKNICELLLIVFLIGRNMSVKFVRFQEVLVYYQSYVIL